MFKIPRKVKTKITEQITKFVQLVKDRLTGNSPASLKALYLEAAKEEGSFYPDLTSLEVVMDSTNHYLDGFKVKTVTSVLNAIESGEDADQALQESLDKARSQLSTVIATQTQSVKNIGALNGIFNIATLKGVDDPVIYWSGPNDSTTCEVCSDLYFLPNGITPRVWKVSELSSGFYNRKHDHTPSIHSAHPNCRHTPSLILTGFGFKDGTNLLVWIGDNHSELDHQRSQ